MSIKTEGKRNSCIFEWKIKNISHCWLEQTQLIASPAFIADVLEGTKWLLWLYPMGDAKNNSDYISVFLKRKEDCCGPDNINVQYRLSFLGEDGSVLKEIRSTRNFTKSDGWGYSKFEERKIIFVSNKGDYLPNDVLTVQCTIWNGETPVEPMHFYSQTVFKVDRRTFKWNIDHFSALKSNMKNEFKDDLIKFDLVLNEGLNFEKKLLLNINLCDENLKYFSFKVSIVDSEGKKEDCGTHEYFAGDFKKEILSTLLFTKKLMDNKSRYLSNDILSLECEYASSNGSVLYEYCVCGKLSPELKNEIVGCQKDYKSEKDDSLDTTNLVNDMKFLYNDGICSDTMLRTPSKNFPAHKGILSARSPVFRSMFSNDMQEKNNGHVDITDIEDDIIHRMLLYIYTDSLEDLNFNSASKLYVAADKYQILCLKNRCSSFLNDNLCSENVCDVLVLADLHNDDALKANVVDYILRQRKQIFCSPEWKDFMNTNVKLAADVMYKKIFQE